MKNTMFNLFRKENLSQEQRLLKHLMNNEGREVTLTSIVIGLRIFHYSEIIRRLRKKGEKEWFVIPEPRMEKSKDKYGNTRVFYKLIKD